MNGLYIYYQRLAKGMLDYAIKRDSIEPLTDRELELMKSIKRENNKLVINEEWIEKQIKNYNQK